MKNDFYTDEFLQEHAEIMEQLKADTERYMQVLERLTQARVQAGLSQSQAAGKVFLAAGSTISHYESGAREISLRTFLDLANLYDVSLTWLLTGHNPAFDEQKWLSLMQTTNIAMEDLDKLMTLMKSLRQDKD